MRLKMGLQSLIQEQRSAGSWGGAPAASASLWNPWAPEVQLEAPSATLRWQLSDGGGSLCSALWLKLAAEGNVPVSPSHSQRARGRDSSCTDRSGMSVIPRPRARSGCLCPLSIWASFRSRGIREIILPLSPAIVHIGQNI